MAGGILRTFGILLIVLGAVATLLGIAAAGIGYTQEEDNQDGLLSNPDESEQNEGMALGGIAAAGIGLVALVLGIVLNGVGGGLRDRAMRKEIRAAAEASRAPSAEAPEASAAPARKPKAAAKRPSAARRAAAKRPAPRKAGAKAD